MATKVPIAGRSRCTRTSGVCMPDIDANAAMAWTLCKGGVILKQLRIIRICRRETGMDWINRPSGWISALGALAAGAPVQVLVATEYLSVEGAQKALFPQADRFNEVVLALSPAQRDRVISLAGPQPPHRSLRAWRALHGDELLGFVFVDEVIGKEDFITYALAIDASGRLSAPEVLAYRESHGGEIRSTAWRQQFAGRQGLDQLRVQTDIKNIAGATLSCQHVTEGVRWLTALWQVALQGAAATPG